jgi:hypothetical protein
MPVQVAGLRRRLSAVDGDGIQLGAALGRSAETDLRWSLEQELEQGSAGRQRGGDQRARGLAGAAPGGCGPTESGAAVSGAQAPRRLR